MTKEHFEELLKNASKKYNEGKQPKRPETQFKAGALWLWNMLRSEHDVEYYEDTLRADIKNRLDTVEEWQESLITETAKLMARRDRLEAEIARTGDLLLKFSKNGDPYQESNPLHVHLKELDRTIGLQREHLGLSFKVNPMRMKQSPKRNETDPKKKGIAQMLADATGSMNEIPD